MEERIQMMLLSYDLEDILLDNDITEEYVLKWLIENDLVRPEDYFEEERDGKV